MSSVAVRARPFSPGAYFMLTKPKIVLLLLVTTLAGSLAAAAGPAPWAKVVATLVGGAMCSGGAGVLNSYIDREVDTLMKRTRGRPLPSGLMSPRAALIFGIVLSVLSLFVLAFFVNPLSAGLALLAWLYYVVVYSIYLKHRSSNNIVIGGVAGAFPPLIGWTAVTGRLDMAAVMLFLIIFFWTPPHAFALTLIVKDDYWRAGIPMLPVATSEQNTRLQILIYTVVLIGVTALAAALGFFGPIYLAAAVVLGGAMMALAVRLYRFAGKAQARNLYRFSTIYLGLLFLAAAVDRFVMR